MKKLEGNSKKTRCFELILGARNAANVLHSLSVGVIVRVSSFISHIYLTFLSPYPWSWVPAAKKALMTKNGEQSLALKNIDISMYARNSLYRVLPSKGNNEEHLHTSRLPLAFGLGSLGKDREDQLSRARWNLWELGLRRNMGQRSGEIWHQTFETFTTRNTKNRKILKCYYFKDRISLFGLNRAPKSKIWQFCCQHMEFWSISNYCPST